MTEFSILATLFICIGIIAWNFNPDQKQINSKSNGIEFQDTDDKGFDSSDWGDGDCSGDGGGDGGD